MLIKAISSTVTGSITARTSVKISKSLISLSSFPVKLLQMQGIKYLEDSDPPKEGQPLTVVVNSIYTLRHKFSITGFSTKMQDRFFCFAFLFFGNEGGNVDKCHKKGYYYASRMWQCAARKLRERKQL